MKNILTKHGIIPDALSHADIELFTAAAKDAKDGIYSPFEDFIKQTEVKKASVLTKIKQLKHRTSELAESALCELEKISPSLKSSVFSAFVAIPDEESFTSSHGGFILGVSEIISSLSLVLAKYAEINAEAHAESGVEFALRKVALSEFSADTNICQKYAELDLLHGCVKEELAKIGILASKLTDELKKLCEESDTAFQAVISHRESYAVYNRVITRYAGIVSTLLANLRSN